MTRLLLGFLCAFMLTFAVGCGGGSTEPTVITGDQTDEQLEQQTEDYEAEMEGETIEGDG
ncbi:hypothetical protein N9D38_09185 [Rubripirellula sp.]|nr:hypothetical protein [Rubripirellula sp.]